MSRRSKSKSSRVGNVVDKEVANLFKLGDKVDQGALLKLRNKYGDEELVNKIQQVFVVKHATIVRGAKKFAAAVRRRYANTNVPYHMLLQKARLHARKYKMSGAEFAEFQRIYEQSLAGTSRGNEVVVPVTNMMRVLGNMGDDGSLSSKFNVKEDDYRNLQEILKLNAASRPLHAQVLLQSLSYGLDFATSATRSFAGEYDKARHNPANHVHPVVAALFLGKNQELDEHFLYASISEIVKARYNQEALQTKPAYELFYNLITDPNDIVCDNRSPIADLLHRANLQNQLWNSVLHLRNGQFYQGAFSEFMTSVDVCRINKYDNPDLVYGRHDGTILKRLLSAFSYRPTVVSTMPAQNVATYAHNPYHQNVVPTVTRIPMITIKTIRNNNTPIDIQRDVLKHTQQFIVGNVITTRDVNVIYSRGVLFVYLDRRHSVVNLGYWRQFNVKNLPIGMSGFERINKQQVNIPARLHTNSTNNSDQFSLWSAVVSKTQTINGEELVIGSEAWFNYQGATGPNGHVYDPTFPATNNTKKPIKPAVGPYSGLGEISRKGVVLVYKAVNADANRKTFQV